MELRYKVGVIGNLRDFWYHNPNIEFYLLGLQDAGVIESYELPRGKNILGFTVALNFNVPLMIKLLDESRREQIDTTLRKVYNATAIHS